MARPACPAPVATARPKAKRRGCRRVLKPSSTRRAGAISWSRTFDDPIPLPDGRELRSLRDAADYIASLPKCEAEDSHWQLAIETLISAADHGGIVMLARIAVLKALNHDRPVIARTRSKDPVWKRKWRERRIKTGQ